MATYFETIISELLIDPYFDKFKFRKKDRSFRLKTCFGFQSIEFRPQYVIILQQA